LVSNASAYCNIAVRIVTTVSSISGIRSVHPSSMSLMALISLSRYVEAERDLAPARQACEPIHALYVLSYSACFAAGIELILGHISSARAHAGRRHEPRHCGWWANLTLYAD
jgi:hypothetical protein